MEQSAHRPTWGRRLNGIEGLRALAALSVVADHVWQHSEGATVNLGRLNHYVLPYLPSGLTLFFALSGFLLYRPFAAAIVRAERPPYVRAYLINRALRILPAYFVILIFVGLVFGAANLTSGGIGYLWPHPVLALANFGLVQNYYPAGVTTGIGPSWSLGAEIIFYLALPLLACGAAWIARGRTARGRAISALFPAVALALIGLVGNIWASRSLKPGPSYFQMWGHNWHSVLERSFLVSADLFVFGIVAAVVVVSVEAGRLSLKPAAREIAGFLGVLVAVIAGLLNRAGVSGSTFNFLMALASGLVILYVVLPSTKRPGVPLRILQHPWMFYLGTISYSIYLWHEPTTKWLHAHGLMFSGRAGFVPNLIIVLAVTISLASLTYRFIEKPANARKRRMTPASDSKAMRSTEDATMEAAP